MGAVDGTSLTWTPSTPPGAPTTLAAHAAYEEAGVGPEDLDVVECQDTDAARELGSCEELGLCKPGGSAALLDSGATALGGRQVDPIVAGIAVGAVVLGFAALILVRRRTR